MREDKTVASNNKGANEDGKRKFILVENNGFQDFREERRGEESVREKERDRFRSPFRIP